MALEGGATTAPSPLTPQHSGGLEGGGEKELPGTEMTDGLAGEANDRSVRQSMSSERTGRAQAGSQRTKRHFLKRER